MNADAPLLATKLQPPRRTRGILQRPRLNDLAADIRGRLLTIVTAPAGYGKTTAALAWSDELSAAGATIAWLSVDETERTAARLAFHLAASLRRSGVQAQGAGMEMLSRLCTVDPGRLLTLLLNALAEREGDVFLFLDDYHVLADTPAFPLLRHLVRHAPANLHLVLLGRAEAPGPLLSEVGPEDLLQIDAATLSFDPGEVRQLVRKVRGEALAPGDIAALHALTEGWPVAVRAMLLAVRPGDGFGLADTRGPRRPISALIDEVLQGLPDALNDFMARIALVEEVCADLAGHLTECLDAQPMIEQIGLRQLFFWPRDARETWFAFHPLFREQLRRRLAARHASEIVHLHRRAAEWFACRQRWSDAVRHTLLAGDDAQAIAWIEQCAMRLLQDGDLMTLLAWKDQFQHRPDLPLRLRLAFAWALGHSMAIGEASRLLELIRREHARIVPLDENLEWECVALQSLLRNSEDDSESAGRLARHYLAKGPADAWTRNVMLNIMAAALLRLGDWQGFHAVPPLAPAPDDIPGARRFALVTCHHFCNRAIADYHQGRLENAAVLFEQAMRSDAADLAPSGEALASAANAPAHPLWVLPAAMLAQVRYQQGRLDDAAHLVAECLAPVRILGMLDFYGAAVSTAVQLARHRGEAGEAHRLLHESESLARERGWIRLESLTVLEQLRLCVIDGRQGEAEGLLARLEQMKLQVREAGVRRRPVYRDVALARGWIDLGAGGEVRNLEDLDRRFEASLAAGFLLDAVRLGATLALVRLRANQRPAGMDALRRAWLLAAHAGAQRLLFDLPLSETGVGQLVQECRDWFPADRTLEGFLGRLPAANPVPAQAQALARTQAPAAGGAVPGPAHDAAGTLTGRERQVLKLVGMGQSNKEIAGALGLAESTIKYHLKSIFAKLAVANRAQAVVACRAF